MKGKFKTIKDLEKEKDEPKFIPFIKESSIPKTAIIDFNNKSSKPITRKTK